MHVLIRFRLQMFTIIACTCTTDINSIVNTSEIVSKEQLCSINLVIETLVALSDNGYKLKCKWLYHALNH